MLFWYHLFNLVWKFSIVFFWQSGPPQYRSRTLFEDVTPEIVREFFWDDVFRMSNKWDDMLLHHDILEECPTTGTLVLHWIRKVFLISLCFFLSKSQMIFTDLADHIFSCSLVCLFVSVSTFLQWQGVYNWSSDLECRWSLLLCHKGTKLLWQMLHCSNTNHLNPSIYAKFHSYIQLLEQKAMDQVEWFHQRDCNSKNSTLTSCATSVWSLSWFPFQ